MNWKTLKGQLLILFSGLFFLAAGVLFLTNIRNGCDLWFGQNLHGSTGMVMLFSALVGGAVMFMFRLLVRGVRDLRIGRLQASLQRINRMDRTTKPPSAAARNSTTD